MCADKHQPGEDEPVDDEGVLDPEDLQDLINLKDEEIQALMAEVNDLNLLVGHLERAIENRSVIEQAKGIIMAAAGCCSDAAFAVLVAQSQAQNVKVRTLAEELVRRQNRKSRPV